MNKLITVALGAGLALMLTSCGNGGPDGETSASAQKPSSVPPGERTPIALNTGEELFNHYCLQCHGDGEGKPGANMLEQKHGKEKRLIKGRDDLPAIYIKTVIRDGLLEMAPFRFTEISDEQLDLVADYVRSPN
ncbi:MAG: cytochrome c [Immundisolibacteraceae bacterium]|nr:cytochrome c [Immundisolibacteraceae bacterium]